MSLAFDQAHAEVRGARRKLYRLDLSLAIACSGKRSIGWEADTVIFG